MIYYILLVLFVLWLISLIGYRKAKRKAKHNNDLYTKKQHEYFMGDRRRNEDDWKRWYEDILERHN